LQPVLAVKIIYIGGNPNSIYRHYVELPKVIQVFGETFLKKFLSQEYFSIW